MGSLRSLSVGCLVLLLAASAATVPGAGAQSDFSISVQDSVDIPPRTVSIDGTGYEVDAVGRVAQGESLSVDVTDPNDRSYDVYLYNSDNQIEQTDSMQGSGTATFSTGSLGPGTYYAAVYYDGNIQVIEPVVVEGYDVTIDPPASVKQGGTATVRVNVRETAGGSRDRVEVVLGDTSDAVRVEATKQDGAYVAKVPTDDFEPGTYQIFGVVRGTEQTESGEDVVLGLSDPGRLEIVDETPTATETPTPTPDDSNDGGGGGGGGGGGSDPTAEFSVNGTVSAETVTVGETVTVDYRVKNVGPVSGFYEATLTLDGRTTNRTKEFELSPQGTTDSSFTYTFEQPGVYTVRITDSTVGVVEVRPDPDSAVFQAKSSGQRAVFERGPVEQVTFERNAFVDVTVVQMVRLPNGTSQPPGTLVMPLNISVPASAADVGATVRLNVSQDTLDAAGVSADDVRLARYDNGTWTTLDRTAVTVSERGYVVLESETPGFSTFAVVGESATPTPSPTPSPTESPTESPTASASPSPTDSPTATQSPTDDDVVTPASPAKTESPTDTGTTQPGFGVGAVAAAVALLALVARRRD